ncbi:FtsX-like permease family protein [Catenulispora yoronensis]
MVPEAYQRSVYSRIPGVKSVMPLVTGEIKAGSDSSTLIGVDAAKAPDVLALRGDPASAPPADLFAALSRPSAGQRPPSDSTIPLPGTPTALTFDFTMSARVAKGSPEDPRAPAEYRDNAVLHMLLRDRDGALIVIQIPTPEQLGRPVPVTIPLTSTVNGGIPAYPLRIEGIGVSDVFTDGSLDVSLDFRSLTAVGGGAAGASVPVAVPAKGSWHVAGATAHWGNFPAGPDSCDGTEAATPATLSAICTAQGGPDSLSLRIASGHVWSVEPGYTNTWVARPGFPPGDLQFSSAPLVPVLVTDGFLKAASAAVGQRIPAMMPDGTRLRLDVTGRVSGFPGLAPDASAVVVDRVLLTGILRAADSEAEWTNVEWLAQLSSQSTASAYVAAHAELGVLTTHDGVASGLRNGGFAASQTALLTISAATAPVFAAVGFAVSAVTSLRGRRREFAVLRAIGALPRQLSAALWLEQAVLAVVAVVAGVAIGVETALLTVPSVTVDDAGAPVFPRWPRSRPGCAASGSPAPQLSPWCWW